MSIRHYSRIYQLQVVNRKEKYPLNLDNFDNENSKLIEFVENYINEKNAIEEEILNFENFENINNEIVKGKFNKFLSYKKLKALINEKTNTISNHDEIAKNFISLPKEAKTMTISDIKIQKNEKTLSLDFSSGKYGIKATIKDEITGKDEYNLKNNNSECRRYYALFQFYENSDKGFLILNFDNIHNPSSIITAEIRAYFKTLYPSYELKFLRVSTQDIVDSYIANGDLKEIKVKLTSIPKDLASKLNTDTDDYIYLDVIKKKKMDNKILKLLTKKLNNMTQTKIVLFDEELIPESIKIRIKLGSSDKTFNVSSMNKFNYDFILEDINDYDLINSDSEINKENLFVFFNETLEALMLL